MLFISSTFLMNTNAGTLSRVYNLFCWVATLILIYSGIICYNILNITLLDTGIVIFDGLHQSSSTIIVLGYS